ncbi:MAG: hypothetical protein N3A38_08815 [Planctomycetota bacterium]|nr:hypothetical protein [Planctomycetota bacterium]
MAANADAGRTIREPQEAIRGRRAGGDDRPAFPSKRFWKLVFDSAATAMRPGGCMNVSGFSIQQVCATIPPSGWIVLAPLVAAALAAGSPSPRGLAGEGSGCADSAGLTDDVSSDLRADKGDFAIHFNELGRDRFRLKGELNGRLFDSGVEGLTLRFQMAGLDISGTLNENGNFRTGGEIGPRFRFSVRPETGEFLLSVSRAFVAEEFKTYGVLQTDVVKPGIPVSVPMTLTLGGTDIEFRTVFAYTGSPKSGIGKYRWGKPVGKHGSGLLLFNRAIVEEDREHPQHRFKIQGYLARPDQPRIVRSDSGNWTFSIGSFTQTIPCTAMNAKGKRHIRFSAPKDSYGIKKFSLDTEKMTFYLSTRGILADGATGRGTDFPLVGSSLTSTTFAFSVSLDLDNGETFSASTQVYVKRKKVGMYMWTGLKKPKTGGGGGSKFKWPVPYYFP